MKKEIVPNIYYVGVNDTETDLFEGLWPLPEGVSYNSYVIKGEKVAVIDTVKNMFADEFLQNVEEITPFDEIDYLILNHMEPDHTGSVPHLIEKAPQATIYCSKRAVPMLKRLYHIENKIVIANEGDKIDLGGKEIVFAMTPLVHWPETMMTYETTEKVLFSGDAFGGFKTICDGVCDDKTDTTTYEDEILRYYSNIVGKFSRYVLKAIDKLKDIEVKVIAPTHGIVWRQNPQKIIEFYIRHANLKANPSITLIYGSMYGNTQDAVKHIQKIAEEEGVTLYVLDSSRDDLSYLIRDSWKSRGILLAYPTYDGEIFPKMAFYLDMMKRKRLGNRYVGFFGSYLWSGKALGKGEKIIEELGWELIEPIVEFQGHPHKEDMSQLRELIRKIAHKVKD